MDKATVSEAVRSRFDSASVDQKERIKHLKHHDGVSSQVRRWAVVERWRSRLFVAGNTDFEVGDEIVLLDELGYRVVESVTRCAEYVEVRFGSADR